jgi:hypothetical protein
LEKGLLLPFFFPLGKILTDYHLASATFPLQVVVCIVADGRHKIHPKVLDVLTILGVYRDGLSFLPFFTVPLVLFVSWLTESTTFPPTLL